MNEDTIADVIGVIRVYLAIANLIIFLMLAWQLRSQNGITGSLASVFFGAFLVNFWSVALLFDWFNSRAQWLHFGLITVFLYALALTALFIVLIIQRTKNNK